MALLLFACVIHYRDQQGKQSAFWKNIPALSAHHGNSASYVQTLLYYYLIIFHVHIHFYGLCMCLKYLMFV